jgi:hypothetical protein
MVPTSRYDFDEFDDDGPSGGSRSAPELFNRRTKSQQVRKRARRNRSNDMAKRGIHQRRNKRVSW